MKIKVHVQSRRVESSVVLWLFVVTETLMVLGFIILNSTTVNIVYYAVCVRCCCHIKVVAI